MTPIQQMLAAMGALPNVPRAPEVIFRPQLLTRSHRIMYVELESFSSRLPWPVLIAWSADVFHQRANRGVTWHDDEPEHCRTWSDAAGCRCDLGDEA